MSDLTFNKIAGAVLVTALSIAGLRELSSAIFDKEAPEKPGYAIEVAEAGDGGGAAEAELPPDWGTVLPVADIKAGEAVFQKCKSCHTIENGGANGTGPGLWGVMGRKPGGHAGFTYSASMTEFGGKQPSWDFQNFYEFVKAPKKYIDGTKMGFIGLKKQEDRVNLIAYLQAQGSTLSIPAPAPAAPAAAPTEGAEPAEGAAAPAAPVAPAAAPAP